MGLTVSHANDIGVRYTITLLYGCSKTERKLKLPAKAKTKSVAEVRGLRNVQHSCAGKV